MNHSQEFWNDETEFSSVTQSCLTLCNLMNCSTRGFPAHHQLLELHKVSDAIQPSHPPSSPFPPALSLSQRQSLFQWVSSLHQVARVLQQLVSCTYFICWDGVALRDFLILFSPFLRWRTHWDLHLTGFWSLSSSGLVASSQESSLSVITPQCQVHCWV